MTVALGAAVWRSLFYEDEAPTFNLVKATSDSFNYPYALAVYADNASTVAGSTPVQTFTVASGTTVTPPTPSGGWRRGFYRVLSTDGKKLCGAFTVMARDNRFGDRPAALSPYTAYSSTGFFLGGGTNGVLSGADPYLHGLMGIGPQRWNSIDRDGGDAASLLSGLQSMSTDTTCSWTANADSTHPREQFVGNGDSYQPWTQAGATTYANQLYPLAQWFEVPWNEPQGTGAVTIANKINTVSSYIKAAQPGAKVLGPMPVSFNQGFAGGWLKTVLSNVTPGALDGVSVHAYNCHNGDPALYRACLTDLTNAITQTGMGGKPIWVTEQGFQFNQGGVEWIRRALNWASLALLMAEQFGIPLERWHYFEDLWKSYYAQFGVPIVLDNARGTTMMPLFYRTLVAERWGKTVTEVLDFGAGALGNDTFVGTRYSDANGNDSIALLACGPLETSVEFTTNSPAPLELVDWAGNVTELTPSGGSVEVPVTDVASYLRTPTGVTTSLVKPGRVNKLSGWTATSSFTASSMTLPDGASANGGYINGRMQNADGSPTQPSMTPHWTLAADITGADSTLTVVEAIPAQINPDQSFTVVLTDANHNKLEGMTATGYDGQTFTGLVRNSPVPHTAGELVWVAWTYELWTPTNITDMPTADPTTVPPTVVNVPSSTTQIEQITDSRTLPWQVHRAKTKSPGAPSTGIKAGAVLKPGPDYVNRITDDSQIWSIWYAGTMGLTTTSSPWSSAVGSFPQQIDLVPPVGVGTVDIDTLTVRGNPTWQNPSNLLDADLWLSADGKTFTKVASYTQPTIEYVVADAADNTAYDEPSHATIFTGDPWLATFTFPKQTVAAARVVVNDATWPGAVDDGLVQYYVADDAQGDHRNLSTSKTVVISSVQGFDSGSAASNGGGGGGSTGGQRFLVKHGFTG